MTVCSQEDSDPTKYPMQLVDSAACVRLILAQAYRLVMPEAISVDRVARDSEILNRYSQGETPSELALAFNLTVQHIRRIVRRNS